MKRYISKFVRGEYISSPLLNFLSASLKDIQDSFNSFIVLNPGILAERLTVDTYDDSLNVDLNPANRQISIRPGSFIDANGIVTSINNTIYPFIIQASLWGSDLSVYIRRFDSNINPGTISISANSQNITGIDTNFLEYLEPGMSIEIVPDPDNPAASGTFKVTGVTSNNTITVSPLPSVSGTGLQFKVRARFLDGVVIPQTSLYPYSFSQYILDYRLSTDAHSSDEILLANLVYDADTGVYDVQNVRDTTNVAKLFTGISAELETDIVNFFVNGHLQIGEGDDLDIYGNSHVQNTDLGTNSQTFEVGLGSDNVLKLVNLVSDQVSFVCSLINDQPVTRNIVLPGFTPSAPQQGSVRLASLDVSQKFLKAQLVNRAQQACMIASGQITVTEEGNIFSVSGMGTPQLSSILVQSQGVTTGLDVSSAEGLCITLFANEPFILTPGSNSNISLSGPVNVQSGEFVTLIVIGQSWKVVSASWVFTSISTLLTQVTQIQTTISSWDVPALQVLVDSLSVSVASLVSNYDVLSQQVNTTLASIQSSINTLQSTVDSMILVPVGGIIMANLTDNDVASLFDSGGAGTQNGRFKGFQICNGNNNSPNLIGRIPVMYNIFQNSPLTNPGNAQSKATGAGFTSNGVTFPTYSLGDPKGGQWDKFLDMEQIPAHNHPFPNSKAVMIGSNNYSHLKRNMAAQQVIGNANDGDMVCMTQRDAMPIAIASNTANKGGISGGGTKGIGIFPATYTLVFLMRYE